MKTRSVPKAQQVGPPPRRFAGPGLLLLAVAWSLGSASAQTPPVGPANAPQAARPIESDALGRTTPWGTVTGFIRAGEHQDFALAAQFLDTNVRPATAAQLA